MTRANAPASCGHWNLGLLRQTSLVWVLHSEIRSSYGGVQEDRRPIGLPYATVLPVGSRIVQNVPRGREELSIRIGGEPPHEDRLLREIARRGWLVSQHQPRGCGTNIDDPGPALHVTCAVVVVGHLGPSDDQPVLRAAAPLVYSRGRDNDQRAAHRLHPSEVGVEVSRAVARRRHAISLPAPTDTD